MYLTNPISGDVAYFEGCVEGGDPYRVVVAYQHRTKGWHNVVSGLRLNDDHPGLAKLHLMLRDGHFVPEHEFVAGVLTFPAVTVAHSGSMPLRLSFEPDAIREHFEEDMDMSVFTDEELAAVGVAALSDETIYDAFHDTLKWAMTTIEHGDKADADDGEDAKEAGESRYVCTYSITSLIDDHAEAVAEGEIAVHAFHKAAATWKAAEWVRENDPHFDDRLDPRVNITDVARED